MTPEQWRQIRHFSSEECGEGMDFDFMVHVENLRAALGKQMHILAGHASSGHSPNSYHYQGRALDFWTEENPRKVMALIDLCGFGGAGIYYWGAHAPWFHIDDRPFSSYQRWICEKAGEYQYMLKG